MQLVNVTIVDCKIFLKVAMSEETGVVNGDFPNHILLYVANKQHIKILGITEQDIVKSLTKMVVNKNSNRV
jgi:hypothetical protein